MENNIGTILEGLDEAQREAVINTEGPVLIVAGAGSGKTRVLTSRIAYVLEKGCDPSRILALTFTKKAANEMKERIGLMVGEKKARRLYMGTFHSVFIRFLREYADRLGYPSSFTIYDTPDSTSAIKRCIKEMNLDEKLYKPKSVLSRISNAKNNLWTWDAYPRNREYMENDSRAKMPKVAELYKAYQSVMKQSGVMDFDDILLNMNILLRDCPDALEAISSRFDYVLVDEYQDTNRAQYLILKKLALKKRNLCVVGDDSQSIYAFRGAQIQNILGFSKDYPDYKKFKLERNYRSTQNIVNAANSVIEKNENKLPKTCYSKAGEGEKIRIIKAYTDKEEALLVASSIISKMSQEHAQYQDFAILYRTNVQSRLIEEALRKRNLPYRIYSGNSFFDRQEIKDMMAYFKLVVNNKDDESFRRIVNTPARGIGDTSVEALAAAAKAANVPLFEAIDLRNLETYGLKAAALGKLRNFASMITKYSLSMATDDAYTVATRLSDECGLYQSYKIDNSVESQSRASNIEELMNSVKEFVEKRHNDYIEELMAEGTVSDAEEIRDEDCPVVSLGEYLEDISLLSAVDTADGDEEDVNNKITMMTVHASKGLEFPYVYVTGMEQDLFPSNTFSASPAEIEEERRLFYVAITRAKMSVVLSFCSQRMKNGQTNESSPSMFLREINPEYLENPLPCKDETVFHSNTYGQSSNTYGQSGKVTYQPRRTFGQQNPKPQPKPSTPASRPSTPIVRPSSATPVHRQASSGPAVVSDVNFIPDSVYSFREGMRVEHNRFGFGKIIQLTGEGSDLKAKIDFDSYGEKVLILKYAKLRKA